jgi:hypothetical protein
LSGLGWQVIGDHFAQLTGQVSDAATCQTGARLGQHWEDPFGETSGPSRCGSPEKMMLSMPSFAHSLMRAAASCGLPTGAAFIS